jgi:hypothetical protein
VNKGGFRDLNKGLRVIKHTPSVLCFQEEGKKAASETWRKAASGLRLDLDMGI